MSELINPNATPEERRIAERNTALAVYITIIVAFLTVVIIAVIGTTQQEMHKTGFKAIETAEPMSFIDKTYVKK